MQLFSSIKSCCYCCFSFFLRFIFCCHLPSLLLIIQNHWKFQESSFFCQLMIVKKKGKKLYICCKNTQYIALLFFVSFFPHFFFCLFRKANVVAMIADWVEHLANLAFWLTVHWVRTTALKWHILLHHLIYLTRCQHWYCYCYCCDCCRWQYW